MTVEDAIQWLRVSADMIERGHLPLTKQGEKRLAEGLRETADMMAVMQAKARRKERERCAEIVESYEGGGVIVDAIRGQGD